MRYLRKNEIKSTERTPHIYIYETLFQKAWILPRIEHLNGNETGKDLGLLSLVEHSRSLSCKSEFKAGIMK